MIYILDPISDNGGYGGMVDMILIMNEKWNGGKFIPGKLLDRKIFWGI